MKEAHTMKEADELIENGEKVILCKGKTKSGRYYEKECKTYKEIVDFFYLYGYGWQ